MSKIVFSSEQVRQRVVELVRATPEHVDISPLIDIINRADRNPHVFGDSDLDLLVETLEHNPQIEARAFEHVRGVVDRESSSPSKRIEFFTRPELYAVAADAELVRKVLKAASSTLALTNLIKGLGSIPMQGKTYSKDHVDAWLEAVQRNGAANGGSPTYDKLERQVDEVKYARSTTFASDKDRQVFLAAVFGLLPEREYPSIYGAFALKRADAYDGVAGTISTEDFELWKRVALDGNQIAGNIDAELIQQKRDDKIKAFTWGAIARKVTFECADDADDVRKLLTSPDMPTWATKAIAELFDTSTWYGTPGSVFTAQRSDALWQALKLLDTHYGDWREADERDVRIGLRLGMCMLLIARPFERPADRTKLMSLIADATTVPYPGVVNLYAATIAAAGDEGIVSGEHSDRIFKAIAQDQARQGKHEFDKVIDHVSGKSFLQRRVDYYASAEVRPTANSKPEG